MQLHPREYFTITRQIEDHTDSTTYYVRAVIRNAKTDALIETVDLTDRGTQRFSESWLVPADGSGQGFYISILTSVYTDSGYTTKSQNYGDKMETYLVQDRVNPSLGGFGGGSDIDYKKVRKIIKEEIELIEFPEFPVFPKVTIPKIDVETPISKVRDEIKAIEKKISSIEIPKPESTKPLHEMMMKCSTKMEDQKHNQALVKVVEKAMQYMEKMHIDHYSKYTDKMKKFTEDVMSKIDNIELGVPEMELSLKKSEIKKKEPEEISSPFDPRVNKLFKKQ